MHNTSTATTESNIASAPVELHYVEKIFINSDQATTALCGETLLATSNTKGMGNGTSYTCPDCMLRYSLLPGGDDV